MIRLQRPAVRRLQRRQRGVDVAAHAQPVDRRAAGRPCAAPRGRRASAARRRRCAARRALRAHAHADAVEALRGVGLERGVLRRGQVARERIAQLRDQLRHRARGGQRAGVERAHVALGEHLAHRVGEDGLRRRYRRRSGLLASAPRRVAQREREHDGGNNRDRAAQAHRAITVAGADSHPQETAHGHARADRAEQRAREQQQRREQPERDRVRAVLVERGGRQVILEQHEARRPAGRSRAPRRPGRRACPRARTAGARTSWRRPTSFITSTSRRRAKIESRMVLAISATAEIASTSMSPPITASTTAALRSSRSASLPP